MFHQSSVFGIFNLNFGLKMFDLCVTDFNLMLFVLEREDELEDG